jgi:hypothetical protein
MCLGANVVAAQKNVQEEVKQNQYQGEEEEQQDDNDTEAGTRMPISHCLSPNLS